jgi:hypothetical protein
LFPSDKRLARKVKRDLAPPADTWGPLTIGSVVLCLDPSSTACGWAVLCNTWPNATRVDSGCFAPIDRPDRNRFDHLAALIRQRVELSAEAGFPVTDAAVEVFGRGIWQPPGGLYRFAIYARAVGVCEATCGAIGLCMNRVSVPEWKGNSKKHETARVVKFATGHETNNDNESDAIGLGLWLCSMTRRPPATPTPI